MSVPAIALYASPPSTFCSTPHHSCQISSSSSPDYDLNPRASSSSAPQPSQKPIVGGLSCLFSSPSVRHASSSLGFAGGDDLIAPLRHDRLEELSCSYHYSPYPSSSKYRDQSPISVFQGPVSYSGSSTVAVGSSSRSPPLHHRIPRDCVESRAGSDRLFSGFIRNALGSCLEYDTPSLTLPSDGDLDPEEFTFNMEEEGFVESEASCEPYAKVMLSGVQSRHKVFYEEFVVKAFYETEKAHRGQMRASGDPYLLHCVETAVLLADIGANATVVAAGLLHDTFDDSLLNYDYIFRMFGAGVAELVEGVSKLSQLSKLARENNTASKTVEADRLHTMFLAMADARAVLIKLADRLHNMMTLDSLPIIKQQRFAKETLEIFVPLANRLGIFSWKEKLENLCFKHLQPEQHKELSSRLVESFDEALVESAKGKLEEALNGEGVSYHAISGRHKSLYSIYNKMLKKSVSMNEIHDINGLRLIVENEDDCYKALDIVHELWPRVTGRLKDYIAHPKLNGYQSLHTVVLNEDTIPLEIQIRTKEMHMHAEFGFAAHWRYKERDCKHSSYVLNVVEWARWVLTWQCEIMSKDCCHWSLHDSNSIRPPCSFPSHSEDCPYFYRPQGDHDGPIFVIVLENEKMSVQEFPANSTLTDLLERVGGLGASHWTADSFPLKEELRPRLNHAPAMDPDKKLRMGDVVELTPAIPDKALTEYREEIQRMYDQDRAVSAAMCWKS